MASAVRARIVHGARVLADEGKPLFFWTFTCRGRDLELESSDDNYYLWTNRALANLRAKAKRQSQSWAYVQVTERQQRGAAHSHFICTFAPEDAEVFQDTKGRFHLLSSSFVDAVTRAGLGEQCHMTVIETPEAVAHYISGYLEKHVNRDVWPPKWKRVRWSRDWPDLPQEKLDFACTVLRQRDWDEIDRQHKVWQTDNPVIAAMCRLHMVSRVTLVSKPTAAIAQASAAVTPVRQDV